MAERTADRRKSQHLVSSGMARHIVLISLQIQARFKAKDGVCRA